MNQDARMKIAIIRKAITYRHYISFNYEAEFGERRIVEPYCLGINHNDNLLLRGYQTEGPSFRNCPNWKMFLLKEMSNLETIDEVFLKNRKGYSRNDLHMDVRIIQEI